MTTCNFDLVSSLLKHAFTYNDARFRTEHCANEHNSKRLLPLTPIFHVSVKITLRLTVGRSVGQ
jgi:hypothetical protein